MFESPDDLIADSYFGVMARIDSRSLTASSEGKDKALASISVCNLPFL